MKSSKNKQEHKNSLSVEVRLNEKKIYLIKKKRRRIGWRGVASQDNSIFGWKDVVAFTASQMKTDYSVIAIKRVGPNYISSLGFH